VENYQSRKNLRNGQRNSEKWVPLGSCKSNMVLPKVYYELVFFARRRNAASNVAVQRDIRNAKGRMLLMKVVKKINLFSRSALVEIVARRKTWCRDLLPGSKHQCSM